MRQSILILTGILFFLEFYIYLGFKSLFTSSTARNIYLLFTASIYIFLLYHFFQFRSDEQNNHERVQVVATVFLAFLLPKLLTGIILLIDDIIRAGQYLYSTTTPGDTYLPERRKFLSGIGLGLAATLTLLILDGVALGKYRHKVRRVKIRLPNLPEAFKGYRIVQISDMHAGSFLNPKKLESAFKLINKQNADLIVFTGDMVNNKATELLPLQHLFRSLKAKDGKFSVLGNHDYGQYVEWRSEKEKDQNLLDLISYKEDAGFVTLRNQHVTIRRDGQALHLVGVENWGEKPFPQYGDLDKATKGLEVDSAKVLLSHDPTHFDQIVKHHPSKIGLTLSGHTHGMQFGLDLKNIKWSPVQYRYKKWVDLYESAGSYLYVNRGFGVIGYPGRVGMHPEITEIELI